MRVVRCARWCPAARDSPPRTICACSTRCCTRPRNRSPSPAPTLCPTIPCSTPSPRPPSAGWKWNCLSQNPGRPVPVHHAQRSYYEALLKAGVRIFLYPKPMVLHAKLFTVDSDVAVIGSSNMDMRSFSLNYEVSLMLLGAESVAVDARGAGHLPRDVRRAHPRRVDLPRPQGDVRRQRDAPDRCPPVRIVVEAEGIRTPDLLIANETRYQLRHSPRGDARGNVSTGEAGCSESGAGGATRLAPRRCGGAGGLVGLADQAAVGLAAARSSRRPVESRSMVRTERAAAALSTYVGRVTGTGSQLPGSRSAAGGRRRSPRSRALGYRCRLDRGGAA